MARTPTRFYGPALIATGPTTIYTVAASNLIVVKQIHIQNPSGAAVTYTLSLGADAAGTRFFQTYSIPAAAAGVTDSVRDHWFYLPLVAAEIITVSAGTNNILTIIISGDLYTLG